LNDLYATWAGHRHPLSPRSPVGFEDLPALKVFYRARFDGAGQDRRLILFEKFRVIARNLPGQAAFTHDAPYYAVSETGENELRAGVPITPPDALTAGRWIVRTGRDSKEFLHLIEIKRLSSTRYAYGQNGEVASVAIEDALGSRVIQAER
jgi:hypothetical protein